MLILEMGQESIGMMNFTASRRAKWDESRFKMRKRKIGKSVLHAYVQ